MILKSYTQHSSTAVLTIITAGWDTFYKVQKQIATRGEISELKFNLIIKSNYSHMFVKTIT